jgi:hypothetical protein
MRPTTCLQGLLETCWHSAKMCKLRWRPPSKLHGIPPVSITSPFSTDDQPTTSSNAYPKTCTAPIPKPSGPLPSAQDLTPSAQSTTHVGPHIGPIYERSEPTTSQLRPRLYQIHFHHVRLSQAVHSVALVSTTTSRAERPNNQTGDGN